MKAKTLTRKFLIFGAVCAGIGYIFSNTSGSIGIMIFLLSWLMSYKEINFKILIDKKALYPLIIFFLIFCCAIFWTSYLKQGQKEIFRFLPFVLFPIAFGTIKPFDRNEATRIIQIFVHTLSFFFTICLITAFIRQIEFWGRGGIFNWYFFYRYDFLEIFDQHPTYLSMFTLLSLTFLIYKKEKIIKVKWFWYLTIVIQTLAIFLYGSRTGYILFGLLAFIYLYTILSSKLSTQKIKQIVFFLTVGFLFLFTAWNIPIIKERILYTIGYDYDYKFNNKEPIKNSKIPEEEGRLLLWQDALDLIQKRPVFGYGAGSSKAVMLQKYEKEKHISFLENRFNAHNSYLELLLSGGVILFLCYLLLLFVLFLNSLWLKKWTLLSFTLIIAITSITETIFISQGVIFFSFFYCFFLSRTKENRLILMGPYPPPIGGISLFIKKLNLFFTNNFEEKITVINEFGLNENKKIYNLHSSSKFLYLVRLIKYFALNNNFSHLYYNGTHGYTRFLLVVFAKILNYKVIFHFHGKSAINFYNTNWLNKKMMQFTLRKADCLLAVNKNIVTDLKEIDHELYILEIPAYLKLTKAEPSQKIDRFLQTLSSEIKYYVSYGTLDRSEENEYNYGLKDLISVFSSDKIKANKLGLILILVLHKKQHFSEYEKILKPLIEKKSNNISVFINKGNEPLTPFFNSVEGYIRYTYEDGLGVSLFEALNSGIKTIATNVCKRPEGVLSFNPKDHLGLEELILKDIKNYKTVKEIDFDIEYKNLFIELGFTLKKL